MNSQSSKHTLIYSLREINSSNVAIVGPKAAHLGDLIQRNIPIPKGIVLTANFFEEFLSTNNLTRQISDETILNASFPKYLQELLQTGLKGMINETLAVRSSAIAEDLPNTSFAGMYETYLNVNGFEDILVAIKKCWVSFFDARVKIYKKNIFSSNSIKMAVIIQKQIDATASGVMFTVNPVTGNPNEIKINAIKDLGEKLVSGQITADEISVTDDKVSFISNVQKALTMKQIKNLASVGRKIEKLYSTPQDIEWAYIHEKLFILQTRPVTAIPEFIDWTPQAKGGWMRHFRLGEWLGEPVTPLFASWLLDRLDTKIFENLDHVTGVPAIKPYSLIINGWYYAQGNFIPSSIPKLLWFGLRYMIPAFLIHPRRVGIITTSRAYWSLKLYEQEWREKYMGEYFQKVEKYEKDINQANINQLLSIIDDIADSAGKNFYSFICIGGSAWKPEAVLAEFYKKHLKAELESSHQVLMQSLGLPEDQSIKHQITNLDWFFPTMGELEFSLDSTHDNIQKVKSLRERKELEIKARKILENNEKLSKKFNKLLFEAQDSAALREEQVKFLTIGWPVMRKALLKIGNQLFEKNILSASSDIFFLQYEELLNIASRLEYPDTFKKTLLQRRKIWEKQRTLTPPDTLGKLSPILIKIFKKYETTLGSSIQKKEGNIYGMPASAGKVKGTVRIITSPNEFRSLQKGEILVAPMTGPAWTSLFSIASGVITDTGSIMAHASLIAREYGIPAIVGTGNATKMLQTGDSISLDGNTGEIIILNKPLK